MDQYLIRHSFEFSTLRIMTLHFRIVFFIPMFLFPWTLLSRQSTFFEIHLISDRISLVLKAAYLLDIINWNIQVEACDRCCLGFGRFFSLNVWYLNDVVAKCNVKLTSKKGSYITLSWIEIFMRWQRWKEENMLSLSPIRAWIVLLYGNSVIRRYN